MPYWVGITQFIYNELDTSNKVISIFLDLTKAMNIVNHNILLQLLPDSGINNRNLNWFQSYLSNRKQTDKIYDGTSTEGAV